MKFPFRSDNGFQTKVWGPMLWVVLHLISLNYPMNPTSQQKKDYRRFFLLLRRVLPCGACRKSYTDFVVRNPKTRITLGAFESRVTLSRWLFVLHNAVNEKLCKPVKTNFLGTLTFYEQFRAQCHKDKKGCYTPMQGQPKRRSIIKILPLTQCRKQRTVSVTCPSIRKDS